MTSADLKSSRLCHILGEQRPIIGAQAGDEFSATCGEGDVLVAPWRGGAMTSTSSINVSDLTVTYGTGASSQPACKDITFSASRGEFIAIVGSSGCGKTTLLNAIAGFVKPSSGAVYVNGARLTRPTAAVTMVFQSYALFPWMDVTGDGETP